MTRSPFRFAVVAALAGASVLVGCGGDDDTADPPDTTSGGSDQEVAGAPLAGRYAHFDAVAYDAADLKTIIVSFGFTDLDVVDGELVATESFCSSDHVTDAPMTSSLSDEATQAIVPESTPVTVSTVDGMTRIQRPETPTGIGITLEDPANDVLPTDPDDPRISDDDNDGKPGVTVTIEFDAGGGGELYIARRERFAYDVTEQDDGSLVGTVTDKSEQLIVDASDPIFLTAGEWVQYPDLTKSPIVLVPVEGEWDCDRLMAERDDLLPPNPEIDW